MPEHLPRWDAPGEGAQTYEVLAVRYATQYAPKSRWYYRYESYGEPDEEVELDYFVWVLRGAERTILVDTGFAGAAGPPKRVVLHAHPLDALRRVGIEPESVETVLVSHFHYDHIGNIGAFGDAEVIVGRDEYAFWAGPYGHRWPLRVVVEQDRIEDIARAATAGRVRMLADGETVAPGIRAVLLPGHSPGQLAFVVATGDGTIILASDAAHYYEEVERDRPFSIFSDLVGMYRGYDKLRELLVVTGGTLVPGHDPDVMRRFPRLEGNGGDLAVRVAAP